MIGEEVPETVVVPQVALYPLIAAPPFEVGAKKDKLALALPAAAAASVGAPGTVGVEAPAEQTCILTSSTYHP